MSVYGVGSNSWYQHYQWKPASNSSNGSNPLTALGSMSGAGMSNQINSMIELTKYAMEQMGLSSDSRVTFSQITKYRNELSKSFNTELQKALESVGVQSVEDLTFAMDANGNIKVQSPNPSDQIAAQLYLDAHPDLGKNMLKKFQENNVDLKNGVFFRLSKAGSFEFLDKDADALNAELRAQEKLAEKLRSMLAEAGYGTGNGLEFTLNEDGQLVVAGDVENAEEINALLAEKAGDIADELKSLCKDSGVDSKRVTVMLPFSGALKASVASKSDSEYSEDLQKSLNKADDLIKKLFNGLSEQGFMTKDLIMSFDSNGNLVVSGGEDAEAINEWLAGQTDTAEELKKLISGSGIDLEHVNLTMSTDGVLSASVNGQQSAETENRMNMQRVLGTMGDEAKSLLDGLKSLGIDPDVEFTIQIIDGGKVKISGTHPDIAKVQKLFDENPDLVKMYGQIEALTGLDDAREAMQLPMYDVRRTVQMESLAVAWWNGGNASSFFGAYSGGMGGMSMLSGLNRRV